MKLTTVHMKVTLAAMAIGALSVVAALHLRHRLLWKPPQNVVRIYEETQRHYLSAPTAQVVDQAAVITAFESAHTMAIGDDSLTDSERTELCSTLAQFLTHRAGADARAYADWMRARGYTPKPLDAIDPVFFGRYRLATGHDPTDGTSPEEVFRVAFEAELRNPSEAGPPVAIATGANATEIQLATIEKADALGNAFDPILYELAQSVSFPEDPSSLHWSPDLGRIQWYIGDSSAGVSHWAAPISLDEIIQRDGFARVARLLFVQRTRNGLMIPTISTSYYDPRTGAWHIMGVVYVNIDPNGHRGGPEF